MAVYCTNTQKKCVVGHRGLYEASWTEEITLTTGGGGWESIQTDFRKVWTKRKSISKGGQRVQNTPKKANKESKK